MDWYDVKSVAAVLGHSPQTVHLWCRQGKLRFRLWRCYHRTKRFVFWRKMIPSTALDEFLLLYWGPGTASRAVPLDWQHFLNFTNVLPRPDRADTRHTNTIAGADGTFYLFYQSARSTPRNIDQMNRQEEALGGRTPQAINGRSIRAMLIEDVRQIAAGQHRTIQQRPTRPGRPPAPTTRTRMEGLRDARSILLPQVDFDRNGRRTDKALARIADGLYRYHRERDAVDRRREVTSETGVRSAAV